MIFRFPSSGCLIVLLLLALAGGTPLVMGLARLAFFGFAGAMLLAAVGAWRLRGGIRQRQALFEHTLVHLLVRLAEADGNLDRREVTVIRTFFQQQMRYDADALERIRQLVHEARGSSITVAELCDRIVQRFSIQERVIVLELLGRLARADGAVGPAEEALLREVMQRLQLGPFGGSFEWFEWGQWQQGPGSNGPGRPAPDRTAQALSVLGLSPGATPEEAKAAWRRLSKEHHPDRVTHLGEGARLVAEEKMRQINAAYDTLKAAGLAR